MLYKLLSYVVHIVYIFTTNKFIKKNAKRKLIRYRLTEYH